LAVAQIKEGSNTERKNAELEHKENMQLEQRNTEFDKIMLQDANKQVKEK